MKQVILDTSFILSCARQKIDFFEEILHGGMQAVIPIQTISELEGLKAELALKMLNKNEFETIDIPGKDADTAIINISKKNPSAIIATLDRDLQKKLKNPKMIIRGRKRLEIV